MLDNRLKMGILHFVVDVDTMEIWLIISISKNVHHIRYAICRSRLTDVTQYLAQMLTITAQNGAVCTCWCTTYSRSLFDYYKWTINNCPLTFFKALLNIIGGKGAISNINYYHYYQELYNLILSLYFLLLLCK